VTRSLDERLTVARYVDGRGQLTTLADDVRRGLTASPKYLHPKYFYDTRGSELFEQITELPEYYQTRTELGILRAIAAPLVAEGDYREIAELGSGSSSKTRTLLDAMEARGTLERYIPVDVSETMLRESAGALLERYPVLRVDAVVGDFQHHLAEVPTAQGRRLVLFLGSTIGNLDSGERSALLQGVRGLLTAEDRFLLGVDLVKDVAVLEAAYNDAAGVTAAFNRNILRVVNLALDGDFAPAAFRHYAPYNAAAARIEMHLMADTPQTAFLRALDLKVEMAAGESIWTESSYKFTQESAAAMLAAADLRLEQWYTDPGRRFGLALAAPA
jgi:L-histidine N-alpha-methyltransferase